MPRSMTDDEAAIQAIEGMIDELRARQNRLRRRRWFVNEIEQGIRLDILGGRIRALTRACEALAERQEKEERQA